MVAPERLQPPLKLLDLVVPISETQARSPSVRLLPVGTSVMALMIGAVVEARVGDREVESVGRRLPTSLS